MKWCVSFPEEQVLLVRPSLTAICYGNKPAAKLLSVLLYRHSIRKESKSDAENINELKTARGGKADQDTTSRIFRKQSQLVADMCDEITEKTLHDVAVPLLQLLGYLDIEENPACNCYMLNLDAVQAAIKTYTDAPNQLEIFLIDHCQLEKFLIDKKDFLSARKGEDGLEIFLIDKKKFLSQLEKVLITIRKSSNCHRGRKPASDVGSDCNSEPPKSKKRYKNKNKEGTNAPSLDHSSISSADKETPRFTAEEETLKAWLASSKIGCNKDANVVKKQLSELLPAISSVEELHKLIEFAAPRIRGEDKTVYLGNLVEDRILKAWLQSKQQEHEHEPAPAHDDQIGMGKEEAEDMLYNNMLQMYPTLITSVVEGQGLYFIGIAKGENDWIDICNPRDWYHLPEEDIDQALVYSSDVSAIAV